MSALSNVLDNQRMQIIRNEFTHLGDKCYLENAGTALYPKIQLKRINEDLLNNVYLNPHSDKYTKDCIEQIRCRVLKHFNTDLSTYSVIFTSGTTQSLKLILESFHFHSDGDDEIRGSFMYLRDSHTSVLGLRELAKEKNADVIHITHNDFLKSLTQPNSSYTWKERDRKKSNTLVAYPAQSNFNGFKYPLNYMNDIKNGCLKSYLQRQLCSVNCNWYILLDAAAFVATNKLDLSVTQPDFVCLSFYKIFGFPTGLGALLVKNNSIDVLSEKKYFGGGTVDIVLSNEDFHVKRQIFHESFEDGTLPFLSIIALKHCFDTIALLIPRAINRNIMDTISYHTFHLAKDFYEQLNDLRHGNGNKAAVLYVDSDFADINQQGGIVAFNLKRGDDTYIGYTEFQHMADLFNISVRTGCFCNSGTCQRHLHVTNKEMKIMHKAGHKCGDDMDLVSGRPTGAIRVSFGYYNTFNDVDKLIAMITRCFVKEKYQQRKRLSMNVSDIEEAKKNGFCFGEEIWSALNDRFFTNDNTTDVINDSTVTLTEICIYPIKSCGAFKIKTGWRIGKKGFEFDREWMIVKDNGVCLTQKQNTLMCMIYPVVDCKLKCLTLTFKDLPSISIPLNQSHSKHKEIPICQSKICTDVVKGVDCGDAVADWISNALGISYLRLIKQSLDDKRVHKKKNSERMLSLSNQAQFLLINKTTVRWLRNRIKDSTFTDDIDSLVDRFRGNLIIETNEELIERDWLKIIIGKNEFKVEGQCSRCQMVCIDQKTGQKTIEPLRTIAEEFGGKLRLGIYLSYIGPVNGTKDIFLKPNLPIKPFLSDEAINR